MADILPECLIEKKLCYLSFKEVTKMSILSKTWLQASLTLPILKFTVDYGKGSMKLVDNIMEKYRKRKIPIEKFDLTCDGAPYACLLVDKWLHAALQNGVKDIIFTARIFSFPIFKILEAKDLRELDLWGCNLLKCVSFTSGVLNCYSLRRLSLNNVDLVENMLQTLLNSCPFIVVFILEYCSGLEKIELLNLQKIKSVSIKTKAEPKHLVKIQAPTLEHLSCYGHYVAEFQNLNSLDISHVTASDGFLWNFIPRFQSLKIQYCGGIRGTDSLNSVSLEYVGYQTPKLKIARESNQLKHSKINLHCYYNLNAAWFCKLRKFLSNSASWSQVTLYFSKCNEINWKDLQLHHRVAILKPDVLNVSFSAPNGEPTFVDALLWSCHPRRLNLQSTTPMLTCFINRLIYMKNLSHAPSHESEPWHSQLKEAKVHKFDKRSQSWHPIELKRGELSIRTVSEREKYFFLLDW